MRLSGFPLMSIQALILFHQAIFCLPCLLMSTHPQTMLRVSEKTLERVQASLVWNQKECNARDGVH